MCDIIIVWWVDRRWVQIAAACASCGRLGGFICTTLDNTIVRWCSITQVLMIWMVIVQISYSWF